MELSKEELFRKLTQQIEFILPENQLNFLQDAAIEKVQVHKLSRCYRFFISIPEIWPSSLYHSFYQQLQLGFAEIAQVKLNLLPKENHFSQELVFLMSPIW